MSDLARRIHSVEPAPGSGAVVAPPRPSEPEGAEGFDWGPVPWLWVAAWLIGWALLMAVAAWWIGDGSVPARAVWMWVLVWAAGGLVVAALLTRAAAQTTERTSARRNLSRAHAEILQLEQRLQASTSSLFQATRTLSEATEMLLEQVDTSRDDLRNQIASAQTLTHALKTQTQGLVSAQGIATRQVAARLGLKPAASAEPGRALDPAPPARLNLRPAPEVSHRFDPLSDLPAPDSPAPGVSETHIPAQTAAHSVAPDRVPVAVPTADRTGWTWSDMLKTVDGDTPPKDRGHDEGRRNDLNDFANEVGNQEADDDTDDGAASVLALMAREGLSPTILVDEGNIIDALGTWRSAGRGAMGQLLSIRFDEPARIFRARLDADPSERSLAEAFSALRGDALEDLDDKGRLAAATTDAGKAWLFVQAALAL